jgi:DNA ligase (NAD+)
MSQDDFFSLENTEIENLLVKANDVYHNGEEPILTDSDYDFLRRILIERYSAAPDLRPSVSVLDKVGATVNTSAKKYTHAVPMLSLSNAFTEDNISDFWIQTRADETNFVYGELKLDGLSLSLTYKNRQLVKATTRGDGEIGEDVTSRLMRVRNIPQKLSSNFPSSKCEIRGEVCLSHLEFERLNDVLVSKGRPKLSNPRNGAAGLMRKDDAETAKLDFFVYQVVPLDDVVFETQLQSISLLKEEGFMPSPETMVLKSVFEAMTWYNSIIHKRATLGIDIDGIVYKINDTQSCKTLGMRSTSPRWAIAHKFPSDRVWTKIKAIELQVGRTGTLAPVARLEPVTVGGVVVSNATLHNKGYIEGIDSFGQVLRDGIDIRVGDWVEVFRSGDVIPRIGNIDVSRRDESSTKFDFPLICPACGGVAVQSDGEAAVKCQSTWTCPPQRLHSVVYAFSRDALNADGVSEASFAQWLDCGWIKTPSDVFNLSINHGTGTKEPLCEKLGWGKTSADKSFEAIEKCRKVRLDKVLISLGIPFVGKSSARVFAEKYEKFEDFYDAALSGQIIHLNGIGEKVAFSIKTYFESQETSLPAWDLVSELEIENSLYVNDTSSRPLEGITVVFTGSLEGMTRTEASESARLLGATLSGSVSKKTTVLVAGPGAGSKIEKALSLGVSVMTQLEWETFLSNVSTSGVVDHSVFE